MQRVLKIGLFPGEGIGPEVTNAAVLLLGSLQRLCRGEIQIDICIGGDIGLAAISSTGSPLCEQAIAFCESIFNAGGIILAGPGGGRFVYDCRRRFDLFYKLNPIRPCAADLRSRRLRPDCIEGVDVLVVRDNSAGIYQGQWRIGRSVCGDRYAEQTFAYHADQVRAVAEVACAQAVARRGELAIVTKPSGIPTISALWLEEVRNVAKHHALRILELEVDYAAFALLQHPKTFDVIVTSNLFGDILSDLGGVLLGSRGLCYGASFSATGQAIYQTNHGAAWDIAGQNRANPVGHLSALAMAFDLSFQLPHLGQAIRSAVETVWRQGWRTEDLAEEGCHTIGTQEMAERIAAALCV